MSQTSSQPLRRFADLNSREQGEIIAYLRHVIANLLAERLRDVIGVGAGLESHEALTAHARYSLLDDPLLRVPPKCVEG